MRESDRVVGVLERQLDLVTGASRTHPDVGAERLAERLGDLGRGRLLVGMERGATGAGRPRPAVGLPRPRRENADRPRTVDRGAREAPTVVVVRCEQEGATV